MPSPGKQLQAARYLPQEVHGPLDSEISVGQSPSPSRVHLKMDLSFLPLQEMDVLASSWFPRNQDGAL